MFREFTKEKTILASKQLDLIYSHLGTLYEVHPNAPRPSIDPPKPSHGPHVDGVIGFVSYSVSQIAAQLGKLIVTSQTLASASNSSKEPSFESSTNVLMVKSKKPKKNQ